MRSVCRVLMVHFSGFYAWLKEPLSLSGREDLRQTDLIQQAWTDSGKVYGYRKLHDDLRDRGETCSKSHVACLPAKWAAQRKLATNAVLVDMGQASGGY